MPAFLDLDRLLRGESTRPETLREGRVDLSAPRLVLATLVCGAVFGLCLGLFAATGETSDGAWQLLSSALKVPLLFLLTLLVTFPSLYVFATLAGSRLTLLPTLRLLVGAVAVNGAVLASFGPVVAFFTLFTTSYPFIVLLDVAFFVLSGAVSLGFLSRAVGVLFGDAAQGGSQGRAKLVFRTWLLIYGVVGAQMGWLLRPFVGNPAMEFVLFRHRRDSTIFEALANLLRDLGDGWR